MANKKTERNKEINRSFVLVYPKSSVSLLFVFTVNRDKEKVYRKKKHKKKKKKKRRK
jgi:hypothetical protein